MSTDTIAAICTGGNSSGVNIIKISGSNALEILSKIFSNTKKLEDKKIIYGNIINPLDNKVLDEVLVSYFKGPKSYTGEDICEINTHGGRGITLEVLQLVLKNGARIAEPGEFSKRAYINGKLDLSKAEAIIDIINAKTKKQTELAVNTLKGGLNIKIKEIRDMLIDEMANIEVNIDYPEYDDEKEELEKIYQVLDVVENNIKSIIKQTNDGKFLKEGIKTAIIGGPNAGKSSLMNKILNEERAIVTDIEGTTRDIIDETVIIGNFAINIFDTAGIRETENLVEKIGIEKSKLMVEKADLIIYVIDTVKGETDEDINILNEIYNNNKHCIVCLNKIDISRENINQLKQKYKNSIVISAKTGEGIEELKERIEYLFNINNIEEDNTLIVANERQKSLLVKALEQIEICKEDTKKEKSLDIIAISIKEACNFLGEITGESASEDVVNRIFEKFCLGK